MSKASRIADLEWDLDVLQRQVESLKKLIKERPTIVSPGQVLFINGRAYIVTPHTLEQLRVENIG